MARFGGGVSMRSVKQSENQIDLEKGLLLEKAEGEGDNDNGKKKYKVPLAKLSVSLAAPTAEELNLKRPSFLTAWVMIKALFPYYWTKNTFSAKVRVVISVSIIFISKAINLYVPQVFTKIINSLPDQVPVKLILWFGLLAVIQKSIFDMRDLVFQEVSNGAIRVVSLETFDHMHKLSLSFHLSKRSGGLIKIVERGTDSIVTLLSLLLFNIFPTILELFTVTLFLLFSYGFYFSMINLTCCIAYVLFTLSVTEYRNQFRRLANKKEREASDIRMDTLQNFETIKYFTSEAYERSRYEEALKQFHQINVQAKSTYVALNTGQSTIIIIGSTLGLLYATYMASLGGFTVGDIIAINTYIAQMFQPLSWLGTSYRMIIQAFTDMENLMDLLNTKPEVDDAPNAVPLSYTTADNELPSIEFNNVSFSYKNGNKILDNVSFKVPAGKSVAIVGETGGGKSTIFRLLCRFYDVNEGEILVGQQDIRSVTQVSLRGAIGVVPQDTVLFNDTIAFNIGFGKRDCSDEDLIDAAERAQILQFINNSPEGFGTIVGERGLRLSGGEKQRVAIARTILKNPPILILDEATSALDSKTEKNIQKSLNDISKGRTTLIIAHRLSTIMHCDEILVLKNGTIIERGDHFQLLNLKGEYAKLVEEQNKKIIIDEQPPTPI
ncbi:ABC transporter B family protein [Heterostelium album PN500]|uniref:ABC transporter B family protein n=1 Tax=Heterostelium pallidum (strain ATCC 26659 / Pp 5 / PN500) TaxID=670386 RepID=D3AVP3_HETP5|nr:ABC transporter B family protein [Heterostelium album PN500]EFA86366.1 ABC transporter B family protein [Heterostelium album PN500]|eukprot:XP_020438471.1 ABC transporter B family protein [Heterostelium album PN500]